MRLKPPPYRIPRPEPERPSRGNLVTIAAGILCEDGMVLCADTEETISEGRKAQASKLRMWHIAYPLDSECGEEQRDIRITVGLAGAGHSDWITAFIQGMDNDVLAEVPDNFDLPMFEKRITEYTEVFFSKYIRAYAENPDHRPQVYMLILVQFPKMRAIYRVHENLVLRAWEESFFWAVGAGAPAFQNLMRLLLGDRPAYRLTSRRLGRAGITKTYRCSKSKKWKSSRSVLKARCMGSLRKS